MIRNLPWDLLTIAVLWLLHGGFAVLGMLESFHQRKLELNWSVIWFWIGVELLRLRPIARDLGVFLLRFYLICLPIITVCVALDLGEFQLNVPGDLEIESRAAKLGILAAVLLIAFWQHRVLTRPGIRALFQ